MSSLHGHKHEATQTSSDSIYSVRHSSALTLRVQRQLHFLTAGDLNTNNIQFLNALFYSFIYLFILSA